MFRTAWHVAVLVLVCAPAASPAAAEVRGQDPLVLLLNSYHEGYRWTDEVTDAVKRVLGTRDDVRLAIEYMDAKRWVDSEHTVNLHHLLLHKYGPDTRPESRPAAVIVADDHALDFSLRHRADLFPGVPLVFLGINDFRPSRVAGHEKVAGVFEDYDFRATLEMVLGLHPDTSRFLVIGDRTLSGCAALERLKREVPRLLKQVSFEVDTDATVSELKETLAGLKPGTVVLYLAFLRDREGALLTLEESRRLVSMASPVPVYCFWDFYPGTGLVGGRGLSGGKQGETAARIVARILAGEAPDTIGVVNLEPNPYTFDFNQLVRFGIPLELLPAGSAVVGRPETFYGRNWGWIWGIVVFVLAEIALVYLYLLGARRRRVLEEQLRQAQKMEAVGQLAAGIAHDFRNRLTVIEGHCDLLIPQLAEGGPERHRVEQISSAAGRAAELTSQLLAFSRRQMLHPRRIDLNATVKDLTSNLVGLIGEHVELRLLLADDLRLVRVDRNQLEQAILNLAANARDAMPGGGTLTIATRNQAPGGANAGKASATLGIPHVVLEISDTGEGMAPDVRERVFEPFFTTKEVGRGTGLGLSMVYGFVQQSGGRISVDSEPALGTTFTLLLPVAEFGPQDRPSEEHTPDPAATVADVRGSILVVEDDPAVLELAIDALAGAGHLVLSAASPAEALSLVESRGLDLDVLVSDVVMPGMSGAQLAQLLVERFPGLAVLLISGYTHETLDHLAPGCRNMRFLGKPFTARALRSAVFSLLSSRRRKTPSA